MIHICDGYDKMDFDKVTKMLTTAYWSEGIGKDEVMQGAANSALVIGAFLDNEQIGYARVISDKTRFAYVSDVIIDEPYRNQGIGIKMMEYLLNHESLSDVYQWMLSTRDNHSLYANFGFQPLAQPQRIMALRRVVKSDPGRRTII
jgi:N-acetylglutamate synthase-like GNAT family acetyltransferase